jgi:DNA-binding PadR family transcriptional regulator
MDLTLLEQQVMLAIIGLQPGAYGVSIQDRIKERTGREPSTGSVYACLDRLADKGFVTSRQGEATAARGGRRKLYFELTASGQHALKQSLQAVRSLTLGLSSLGLKGAII